MAFDELETKWKEQDAQRRIDERVLMLVTRASASVQPGRDKRTTPIHDTPESFRVDEKSGIEGDRWKEGKDEGMQVSLIDSRVLHCITDDRGKWHLCGNNLIVDFDLSQANCPPGTRLQVGSVILEISEEPHEPCDRFAARYGQEAHDWMEAPEFLERNLRGLYSRVVQGGVIRIGDQVSRLEA